MFRSTCTTFVIYTYLAWYNATNLRFQYVKQLLIQPWKAPLACNVMTTPTSVVRTTSMFTQNVYCDVTNFAPFELLRHVGADKHHLLWSFLTKVVPGLIWMRADMTVYQPGNFLCNLLIKKSTYVIMSFITNFTAENAPTSGRYLWRHRRTATSKPIKMLPSAMS